MTFSSIPEHHHVFQWLLLRDKGATG